MKQIQLNVDVKLNEIHRVLGRRVKSRIQKLQKHKKSRVSCLKRKVLGSSELKQISSDDASSFLIHYGDDLIEKIHQLSKSFNPCDAFFILARLPRSPSGSRSSSTNARKLSRTILSYFINPSIMADYKAPEITEKLVNRVILFDDLCADLHGTQSVYRVLEKVRFFGERRVLNFHQRSFSVEISKNVKDAIDSFNARTRRGGTGFWNDISEPSIDTVTRGLYVYPIHIYIPLLNICPEEKNVQIIDPNFPRGWPFFCLDGDPIASLYRLKTSFDINRLNKNQQKYLGELIYIAGIRQQLYEIRCLYISKSKYGYDIESKGYIKLEYSSFLEGIKVRTEHISRKILSEELLSSVLEQLNGWLHTHTSHLKKYPDTIMNNWQHPLLSKIDKNYIYCFPDVLDSLEYEVHERLNNGGLIGTAFYGAQFEAHIRDYLRQSNIEKYGWCEWEVEKPFVHPETGEHIAEVDYACYRDNVLFVVDAKSYRREITLEHKDAKKDWKYTKHRLDEVIETAKNLASNWLFLNPSPPPGIQYIISIICIPEPVFSKVSPPYLLFSINLENQLEQKQQSVFIPKICTVEEFSEVLSVFSIDEFIEVGGTSIEI